MKTIFRIFPSASFLLAFIGLALLTGTQSASAQEFKTGRWVGYMQVEGSADALAVTMDSVLLKSGDESSFPYLAVILKTSLGGYSGGEYETEMFENVHFDFNSGLVTLDEEMNEMVVTAHLDDSNGLILSGNVFFRSSGLAGRIELGFQSDEPGEDNPVVPPALAPTLSGQFEGTCAGEKAVLQIETARGVNLDGDTPIAGLDHYQITGVVGVENGLCEAVNGNGIPNWCVDHSFGSGTYNHLSGRLIMSGLLEADECSRVGDRFNCRIGLLPRDSAAPGIVRTNCEFKKVRARFTEFNQSSRRHQVFPTTEERQDLPMPQDPGNTELVKAVSGSFVGYVHNETTNRYQPLKLIVLGSIATDNPHNPNRVFVSATSLQYFAGGSATDPAYVQQYDRQVASFVKGYVLQSGRSDSMMQVTEWKNGYISGVVYSRAFGRIGTFQLVKRALFPEFQDPSRLIPSVSGAFRGGMEHTQQETDFWKLNVVVPAQQRSQEMNFLRFIGNYQLFTGGIPWPVKSVNSGVYDFNADTISWKIAEDNANESKIISGRLNAAGTLLIHWPNDRAWAVSVFDHRESKFMRVSE